jgi:WD40 repeat protein
MLNTRTHKHMYLHTHTLSLSLSHTHTHTRLQVGQDAYESTDGSLGTHVLEGHTDTVACLAFNSQGTHLATGGMDGGWVTYRGCIKQRTDVHCSRAVILLTGSTAGELKCVEQR